MSYIALILRLIPAVIKLISIAEQAFDDVPDSGVEKKAMVVEAVKAIIQGVSGFVLDDAMWVKIQNILDPLIDLACSFLFPKED